MIEGAGLGKVHPDAIGPCSVQEKTGVVAVRVPDEQHAAEIARMILSFFLQPYVCDWRAPSADAVNCLNSVIPANRKLMYNMITVITGLCDDDSVLEIHKEHGPGVITALARLEGRAVGLIANNARHLGGALDAESCEKAARFVRLCNQRRMPLISLIDTPGFLVGPEAEASGVLRRGVEFITAAANATVPIVAVVVRKAFGLGAMAMAGGAPPLPRSDACTNLSNLRAGSLHVPLLTLAWPLADFGAMGLEGAVRLGMRNALKKITDENEREEAVKVAVEELTMRGRAVNVASMLEIDDVVEPFSTRSRIAGALKAAKL
jgi:acetyl-CoA carboxylase carboxyltransferase component